MAPAIMRTLRLNPVHGTGDLLARLLWLAMAAIHIGPLLRVGGAVAAGEMQGARWISLVALLLSLAFFGLKILGASFLRVRGRWMPVVLFLVACGLLHGNATPHQWLEKTGYTVLAVGTVAGASELRSRRVRRRIAGLARRLRGQLATCIAIVQRVLGRVEEAAAIVRLVALCESPPRAPPMLVVLRAC